MAPTTLANLRRHAKTGGLKAIQRAIEQEGLRSGKGELLAVAAAAGHADIVEYLLLKQTRPDYVDGNLQTALHVAAKSGHAAVCTVLLSNTTYSSSFLFATDVDGQTALHLAAEFRGSSETARILLESGASVTVVCDDGWIPLLNAVCYGTAETVALLLKHNSDVQASTADDGWTALHLAAFKRRPDVAAALLEAGAEVDAVTNDGATPLILAAQKNDIETARLLLQHGSNVNHMMNKQFTALRIAFAYGAPYHSMVVALVRGGARQWSAVPENCKGLGSALFDVWWKHPDDVPLLIERMERGDVQVMRFALLRVFPRVLPDVFKFNILSLMFE